MKKLIVLIAALLAAMLIVGCASKPAAPSGPPASELMASAKGGAPAGVLIGQGTTKAGSKEASERRAKEIATGKIIEAMVSIVGGMIDDQVTSGRLTSSVAGDFRKAVNTALTRSSLGGVVKLDAGFSADDTAWAVYYLSKADTLKEVNIAVAAAKEAASAGNFSTNGFDAKYEAAIARDWKN